jgi:hypothetical protein
MRVWESVESADGLGLPDEPVQRLSSPHLAQQRSHPAKTCIAVYNVLWYSVHVSTSKFFLKKHMWGYLNMYCRPRQKKMLFLSVVDLDPEVFAPPGYGSVIICRDLDTNPSIIKEKKVRKP